MELPRGTAALSLTAAPGTTAAQAIWVFTLAVLTAVGAQIEIPHQPVPYTLQTLFVLLSGALLGKRNGALSQGMYLLAGALGAPVYAGFGFGMARLLGPTGGYLLGFPVAAFVVGYVIDRNVQLLRTILAMAVGLFIVFSLGTLQLDLVYLHDVSQAGIYGFLI